MFKLIYVRERGSPKPAPYRLLALFDLDHAQTLGLDDADYSKVDALVSAIREGGDEVLEIVQSSLGSPPF